VGSIIGAIDMATDGLGENVGRIVTTRQTSLANAKAAFGHEAAWIKGKKALSSNAALTIAAGRRSPMSSVIKSVHDGANPLHVQEIMDSLATASRVSTGSGRASDVRR
jgi:hypothetical protein